MQQYLNLLQQVLNEGTWQSNRTGIATKRIDGAMLQFDMAKGFPAMTTKKLAFNAVKGELIGFIRGVTNAAQFRQLGCKVWDQNANENEQWLSSPYRDGQDDLGRIYGAQWRDWSFVGYNDSPCYIDQLATLIDTIKKDPTNRRMLVTAWNPGELKRMALPPCHLLFQVLIDVSSNRLSLCMYQRSCDMFLGIPFNIASYALLLHILAKATGYLPGRLTMFLADVHIYENHIYQVELQLTRKPIALPQLFITPNGHYSGMEYVSKLEPDHISLLGYRSHPAIKAEMAV